jgi:D-glycero-D-manno-heptose 1,7-bisphosphate phosphatase
MNKAVFFDKDGVLNIDKSFQEGWQDVELYPDSGDVIGYFRSKGYKIFVITNQPVIARGLITEEELIENFRSFEAKILAQNSEAIIDKIYYCPHHPNATIADYRINCECRKPKPGLLLRAAKEFDLNLKDCYMIGDRKSDIIAGYLAGCITIQVQSGMHLEKMIQTDLQIPEKLEPDFVVDQLSEIKSIV